MLTLFTNFLTLTLSFNRAHCLIKLTLKKKYKINKINNLCDISAYIT